MDLKVDNNQGWYNLNTLEQPVSILSETFEEQVSSIHRKILDVFEKSEPANSVSTQETEAGTQNPVNVSYQFDLFYELSTKVQTKMGRSGAEKFFETTEQITETFKSSFKINIDVIGCFMDCTDKSLDISNEATNTFFDAIAGLGNPTAESLEKFLKASNDFFGSLEDEYGDANGAFSEIREKINQQVKDFFSSYREIREEAEESEESTKALSDKSQTEKSEKKEDASALTNDQLKSKAKQISDDLIELLKRPEKTISQDEYKSFLTEFLKYATSYKQNIATSFFGSPKNGYFGSDDNSFSMSMFMDAKTSLQYSYIQNNPDLEPASKRIEE